MREPRRGPALREPVEASRAPGSLEVAITVLAPFAAGYFLSYLYRSINAVVAPDLVRDIGLSASELGLLTASYLVAFALFQLPLGVALDRFGPRRVQTVLLLTAATGSCLFATASSAVALSAARALIGLGFAGGLMAGFKAVVLWLPPARHSLANACIMSLGGLGLVVATVPAELVIRAVGWRGLFLIAAAVTAAVAALIFVVVPQRPDRAPPGPVAAQLRALGDIFRDRLFWRVTPLVATTAGSHIGIHTLWAGPWLRDVGGLDRDGVAVYLLAIAAAFLVGTLLAGVIADRVARRGVDPMQVVLCGVALFVVAQLAIIAELLPVLMPMWVVFGMTGQASILAFPVLTRHFGAARSSRAQTAMNLAVFLAAFGAQAVVGGIIDLYPATETGGYAPAGYRAGFTLLLGLQLVAFAWYVLAGRRGRDAPPPTTRPSA